MIVNEKLKEEAFAGMDCRPGPGDYPAENAEAILPDHLRAAIERRKAVGADNAAKDAP